MESFWVDNSNSPWRLFLKAFYYETNFVCCLSLGETVFLQKWMMLFPLSQSWEAEDFKGIFVKTYFVACSQMKQFSYSKTPHTKQLETWKSLNISLYYAKYRFTVSITTSLYSTTRGDITFHYYQEVKKQKKKSRQMASSVINSSKYYTSINSMDFQEQIFNMSITWEQTVLYFTKVSTLRYFTSGRVTTLTTTKCPMYHIEDTGCTIRNDSTGYLIWETQ